MKYEDDWVPEDIDWSSTRGRILRESSILFAQHGYFGTSTRDLAQAVHIQQPSLFHHFKTKHDVFRTLVEIDLGPSILRLRRAVNDDSRSCAERLHEYIAVDTMEFLRQPYDARGLYQDPVLALAEFSDERAGIALLHTLFEQLILQGQSADEFLDFEPGFVQRASTGVQFETLRERGGPSEAIQQSRPLQTADFVLSAILTDSTRIETLHTQTQSAIDAIEGNVAKP